MWPLCSTQACKRTLQAFDLASRLACALAVLLHHLRLRPAETKSALSSLRRHALRGRRRRGRARAPAGRVRRPGRSARRAAGTASPRPARSARCRRAPDLACATATVGHAGQAGGGIRPPLRRAPASPAPHRAAGSAPFSDGGTFISARTTRMAVMKRITQSISSRAAASPSAAGSGHGARIRLSPAPNPKPSHSASVTKGAAAGCSSRSNTPSTWAAVARSSSFSAPFRPQQDGLGQLRRTSHRTRSR